MRITRATRLTTAPLLAAALLTPAHPAAAAPGPGPSEPAARPRCAPSPGWTPTAGSRAEATPHAYVGNGYLATRVPAAGAGFRPPGEGGEPEVRTGWPLFTPRYDGAFVSGLYARGPENTTGRQAVAALPNWTGLEVTAGGETYGPASRVTGYRQTLLLRCGLVRTALTWTGSDGRRTDLVYEVLADRNAPHGAAVRLRITPHWSGTATVTDRIDGRAARRVTQTGGGAEPGAPGAMAVSFRTEGTGVKGAVASVLRTPDGTARPADGARSLGATQSASFPVRSGRTYEAVKYVGVDTSLTSRDPRAGAVSAARAGARRGWRALYEAHAGAWRTLWESGADLDTAPADPPGRGAAPQPTARQEELRLWLRSARYGLLSSTRPGARDSLGPTGLTSDNYAGMIFWDAETWMFPSLLATDPDLARTVLDYRVRTSPAARDNARKLGFEGLFFPWTSASSGDLWGECQSWNPPHCVTQNHLQGDIALAAWQYWLATGDRGWLRRDGEPLLRGLAEFWASRVTANPDGSYSVKGVAGPDEYSNGVDDGVYTNAVAATALRHAASAAEETGANAPPEWRRIADGLRIPYDAGRKVFLQYDGYEGSRIKQADAVLLAYPLDWPMPDGAAAATLDYYAARTDPDGPAMTDSVHSVIAAGAGEPGCAAYTYLERSVRPFTRGPYALFAEARGDKAGADDPLSGTPAEDFLTGKGGFLQSFTHGLTGMRLRAADRLHLDPVLPPQLARGADGAESGGVAVRGLRWRGRAFDVVIGPGTTEVRLTSGAPFTVETPEGRSVLSPGVPLTLKTRRPDLAPTSDPARCAPVRADSEEPGLYAEAAVDGAGATVWSPAADAVGARLTAELASPTRVVSVTPEWAVEPASYRVEVSVDGRSWQGVGTGVPVRQVRLVLRRQVGAELPALRELGVRGGE
ncbi:haloacid dehalogenase [Streptomyces albidoflavus]|uniref:glycosyl hydrolase family 65 protein n=1 Tax=Streptomyces albidoflavus TaxID=1886 RepID=UPI0010200BE9|nr:glycosyl hydrolase family 65 protein [Streptomyces albidoflavus]RZE62067.1 haloacid dehalogenase [Streptomyces albidoflavus]